MFFPGLNLKNKKYYERKKLSRKNHSTFLWEEYPYCPLMVKASATVEALLLFPVIVAFFAFFLWIIESICVHSLIGAIVNEMGNRFVNYSYAYEIITDPEESLFEDLAIAVVSEGVVRKEIEKSEAFKHIENLTCIMDAFEPDKGIDIHVVYRVKPLISIPWYKGIYLENRFFSNRYIGFAVKASEKTVYITKESEVYHTGTDCRGLKTTIYETTKSSISKKRSKKGNKYYPCEKCKNDNSNVCFYTPQGTRYHTDKSCPELKMQLYQIPISEIGDKRKCFYCK